MPSSSRTAAAVAATAAIATLVLAPPPDVSAALSVFDMRNLDNSIAALGLWPNKEMAARGDLAGWCISKECFDKAFRVELKESDLLVGDFSVITFLVSILVAAALAHAGMWHTGFWARKLFTSYDANKCLIPSQLPWPDPPGNSKPFDVPVPEATEKQIADFLAFRGIKCLAFKSDEEQREVAAREAVAYMGELWEHKQNDWQHRHYALREKGLVFPYRAPFMNDWNFWGEMSANFRAVGQGQVTFATEHFLIGVLFPLIYVVGRNEWFFYFGMYADMAFESYDLMAMFWRRLTGVDRTVSRYHMAVDSVFVPHHLFTIGFEMVALMAGPGLSKPFMSQVLLGAHITGGLMLSAVCMHQTPAQSWPRFLYRFQAFVLSALYCCRVIWWTPLAAASLRLAYVYGGDFPPWLEAYGLYGLGFKYPLVSPIFLSVLVLIAFYTHFNLDLVQYNTKLLRKAAARLRAADAAKRAA